MIIHFNTPGELLLPCRQGWTEKHAKELNAWNGKNETCQFDSAG